MKKVYDYTIPITISIPSIKRRFVFNLSIHSTIKELTILLSEKLGYDPFTTNIDFFSFKEGVVLNPISTLLQNRIEKGDILSAKITITNKQETKKQNLIKKLTDLNEIIPYKQKEKTNIYGIVLEGICNNQKCLSLGEEMIYPLGDGIFDLFKIINNTKCPTCPYREFSINPPIIIKKIKLINCWFNYEGNYKDDKGFLKRKFCRNLIKIEGENSQLILKILSDLNWIVLNIIIKPL